MDLAQRQKRLRLRTTLYVLALIGVYIALVVYHRDIINQFIDQTWWLPGIGVFGAIIANGTGTGGGIVFVPAFSILKGAGEAVGAQNLQPMIDLRYENTLAISFLIQCFGMSIGSVTWLRRFYGSDTVDPAHKIDFQAFAAIVFATVSTGIPALVATQNLLVIGPGTDADISPDDALTAFKWFSLILGIVLLVFAWRFKRAEYDRFLPGQFDYWMLALIGAVGGFVTALFSVGIGEFIAIYLILRKFPTSSAVAIAVVVSVICVISGVWFHAFAGNIKYEIALLAIPGAMIGGFIARPIATWLGPLWLKTWTSVLIIVGAIILLWL